MNSDDINKSLTGNEKKELIMPGAIVHSVNMNKQVDNKIRVEYFSIGPERTTLKH